MQTLYVISEYLRNINYKDIASNDIKSYREYKRQYLSIYLKRQ